MKCNHCSRDIAENIIIREAARINGRRTSKAKAQAVRENGKLGGRPKKKEKKRT